MPLAHARERNDPHHALFRRIPPALKTVEEESAILNQWSPDCPAKRIANQLWPGVPFIADTVYPENDVRVSVHIPAISIIEKIVGREYRVPMSFKESAVEVIRARLCYQRNLRTRGPTLARVSVCGGYPKFLDCFGVQANDRAGIGSI